MDSIEKGVALILEGLKERYDLDTSDGNFTDTPKRVSKMYEELFAGIENTDEQVKAILDSAFPCDYNNLILMKDVEAFSMCPHHFLPVQYNVHVAYIPAKKRGRVIGLSKLARLVDILARRPVLQEQFVDDVTEGLMKIPGCVGAACIAEGKHFCMIMRGVKQSHANTVTSSLKGDFFGNPEARQELLDLIKER